MAEIQLKVGSRLVYECVQPTPMLLTLTVHASRAADIITQDLVSTSPAVPVRGYHDGFGNWVTRLVAPAGRIEITGSATLRDAGQPDPVVADAQQHPIDELPENVLVYLLGSRYCDTDRLSNVAWELFGNAPTGWGRVQAICDFVHDRIEFDYNQARDTRTAFDAFEERIGVCRDYAHLATALSRCMNIPARYCTGYIAEIGTPPSTDPMDFSAWFQVYLSGAWHTFDARHNIPRIGRVLMATGRDATDVPISNNFGSTYLADFEVWCDPISNDVATAPSTLSQSPGLA